MLSVFERPHPVAVQVAFEPSLNGSGMLLIWGQGATRSVLAEQ